MGFTNIGPDACQLCRDVWPSPRPGPDRGNLCLAGNHRGGVLGNLGAKGRGREL